MNKENYHKLNKCKYKLKIYRIGYNHNDPYSRYLEMGRPVDLKREEVADLKALSSGKPESESEIVIKKVSSQQGCLCWKTVFIL